MVLFILLPILYNSLYQMEKIPFSLFFFKSFLSLSFQIKIKKLSICLCLVLTNYYYDKNMTLMEQCIPR